MFQRLIFTIATAGCLIGLYAIYSVAMRPVVVIPELPQQAIEEVEGNEPELPVENVRVAEEFIPNSKWAANSQHTMRVEDGFVYTDDVTMDEETKKTVTFEPFAIVWLVPNKETGKKEAVSIVSESAQVEFASKFDEQNRNPGRVVRAMLNGQVEINGPQNFHAKGRNFIFDESSLNLLTFNPVRFRFQKHVGSASRMEVRLLPAEGMPSADRPHVRGIESVRLIAGHNLNPNDTKNEFVKLQLQIPNGDEVIPVRVRCASELEYTVATNTAVMSRDVIASNGVGKSDDWMECDTLTMQFSPKVLKESEEDEKVPAIPGDPSRKSEFQKFETDLEFSWMEATSDLAAGRYVKIRSRSRGIVADMARLAYHAASKVLTMDSEQTRSQVSVVMNQSKLLAPRIEAEIGESTLTSLFCQGEGELEYFDERSGRLLFDGKWQNYLSMKRDPATQLDLIEFSDKVQFRQRDQNSAHATDVVSALAADLVKIWFVPTTVNFNLSTTQTKPQEKAATAEPEPKRIFATGDVAFVSVPLQIERTNQLEVVFDTPAVTEPTVHQSRSRKSLQQAALVEPATKTPRIVHSNRTRSKQSQTEKYQGMAFASVPANADGTLGPAIDIPMAGKASRTSKTSKTPAEPFVVSADSIFARVQRIADQTEPELRELSTQGRVIITQKDQKHQKPFRLEGDRIHVQSAAKDREIIDIIGGPALIENSQFHIEGKDLHLDRGINKATVKGAGELSLAVPEKYSTRMPGQSIAFGSKPSQHSDRRVQQVSKSSSNSHLRIRWAESMNFDGQDATFIGRVEAKLGFSKMHCEQMVVQLVDYLSFQADSLSENPDLKLIRCLEKVSFENSSYDGPNLIEVYRGEVGEFTLFYAGSESAAGRVVAQGPGEIRAWQRQAGDEHSYATPNSAQANRPIPTEVSIWRYSQVQFEGQLKGTFGSDANGEAAQQRAEIDDRVEVIYGPVNLPNEKVDPDRLPSGAGTVRCSRLEIINHNKSETVSNAYVEAVGQGNAEVEGQVDRRRFTGSADLISYDGKGGNFILRALGRQNAHLTGTGVGNQSGQRIEFNPALRTLRVSGATHGQFSR